ncbi:MAG: 1-acyl-sn-glycerol-3-phosphate acyltransferase [Chitinophagaceae bacterium]
MLYHCLKIIARVAIRIFCRKIIINKPGFLKSEGPLLLACNHPNSFLDSVILDTLLEKPIWSLARGDVFKNPFYIRLLTALKILPVYRTSEGVENLSENYKTFDACIGIFRDKGIVAIFSEGKCINEWHLRPLKKGTARLAIKAWEENIPLNVLPVGINYSSFRRFGKNVFLNFGELITKENINFNEPDGLRHQAFNSQLQKQLEQLVFEIPKTDKQKQKQCLEIRPSPLQKCLLSLPAAAGWLLHLPLYLPVKQFAWKKTHNNDHYDSVMTGLLLFAYPLYLFLLMIIAWILVKCWWVVFLLLVLPFAAWSYVQLKPQLDK